MDAIDFLRELIAIPSLSGAEATVAHYLVQSMEQLGFAAHVDKAGNAIGVRAHPDADGEIRRDIVLLGHMDTVPGDIPVRIQDGRLYGRGAVDAKGPLATFVMSAARAVVPVGTRLIVIGAVEEESATSKGARFIRDRYQPDWCIIGEPSGWDGVTLGYKGRLLLDYTYRQPMSHTAGAEVGAAEVGLAWYQQLQTEIERFNEGKTRLFDQLLPSIRHIQTDSNGLVNQVTLRIGLRLPPDFEIEPFLAAARSWSGSGSQVEAFGHEPAFASNRRSSLARAFNMALRRAEVKPRFKVKTGTSDMNVVGPTWNCPIVAYGPGDSRLDHTPEEHIILTDYLRAIEVLTQVLESETENEPETVRHHRLHAA